MLIWDTGQPNPESLPLRLKTVNKTSHVEFFTSCQAEDIYRINLSTCNGTLTEHVSQKRDTVNAAASHGFNPIR